MPLRAISRRAIEDGDLALNPTSHLRLPAVRGRRGRIASLEEAQGLLAALPERDRAVWATALNAGLRRHELMALRREDFGLAKGVIHLERASDEKSRIEVTAMSHASIQTTYDLYGNLMPGSEAEAAALIDAHLARADTGSRLEQLD